MVMQHMQLKALYMKAILYQKYRNLQLVVLYMLLLIIKLVIQHQLKIQDALNIGIKNL